MLRPEPRLTCDGANSSRFSAVRLRGRSRHARSSPRSSTASDPVRICVTGLCPVDRHSADYWLSLRLADVSLEALAQILNKLLVGDEAAEIVRGSVIEDRL